MQLLTSVLAYIMASWPPLSHKNLTHDIVDKWYFWYTTQPYLLKYMLKEIAVYLCQLMLGMNASSLTTEIELDN